MMWYFTTTIFSNCKAMALLVFLFRVTVLNLDCICISDTTRMNQYFPCFNYTIFHTDYDKLQCWAVNVSHVCQYWTISLNFIDESLSIWELVYLNSFRLVVMHLQSFVVHYFNHGHLHCILALFLNAGLYRQSLWTVIDNPFPWV